MLLLAKTLIAAPAAIAVAAPTAENNLNCPRFTESPSPKFISITKIHPLKSKLRFDCVSTSSSNKKLNSALTS